MEPKKLSPGPRIALGLAFVVVGAALAVYGLLGSGAAVNPLHWLVVPCGIFFACAGVLVAFPVMNETLRAALYAAVFSAFGVTATWIGLGPGERHFSSSVGVGNFGVSGPGSVTAGRIFFGALGMLADLVAIAVWWKVLKRIVGRS
jgi:hypothetical protein